MGQAGWVSRADSRFAPIQWETALLVTTSLIGGGANIESALGHCKKDSAIAMELCLSCTNPSICVSKLVTIGSGNGGLPVYHEPII